MHLVPVTPPAQIERLSGFDYMTADPARGLVYAAHTGSRALLIMKAGSGAIVGQVEVGPMHGVAVDPDDGHVFTGDGENRTISEVDPVGLKVVRTAAVDGKVDAIAYDPALHRVYADEDDGTRMFVVDTETMREIATVALPGHKPEYLAIDPETHDVYQNIDDLAEIAVIDPQKNAVARTFPTPQLTHDHPLVYDPAFHLLVAGGKNGTLASYRRDGAFVASAKVQAAVDQCAFDPATHRLACAGSDKLTVATLSPDGGLQIDAVADTPGAHTTTFAAGDVWIVWADKSGDFAQRIAVQP